MNAGRITPYADVGSQGELAPGQTGVNPDIARAGFVQVIWTRRWWVLLSGFIFLFGAWIYVSKQTPIYQSSTRLYIQQYMPKIVAESQSQTLEAGLTTQCEILRSTPLLASVAELPEVQQMPMMRGAENLVAIVKSGLTVDQGTSRDLITVSFESAFPTDAAQLVNLIAQTYIDQIAKQHHSNAGDVLKSLQKEKDKQEQILQAKIAEVLEFKRKNGMLSFQDERGNIILQRLSKISDTLTTAQLEMIEAQANLESLQTLKSKPELLRDQAMGDRTKEVQIHVDQPQQARLGDVAIMDAAIDALHGQLRDAELQISRLKRHFTDEDEKVQDAQADYQLLAKSVNEKLARLEDQKKKLVDSAASAEARQKSETQQHEQLAVESYLATVERKAKITEQRAKQLETAFEKQKTQAFDLNAVSSQYLALEAELKRVDRLYNILADRIKEINVNEDTGFVKPTILEVARPAVRPIRPDKVRIIGVGLLLGLMLGIGTALGLDYMDQTIRSAEEVVSIVQAQVLGLVPHIRDHEAAPERGRKVHLDSSSDVAEAYRTIRTALYFGTRNQKVKRILVTSPAPGDGKTTSASNLAIVIAQAGHRVILIDCDCRRPTQHKIFQKSNEIGISSVLAEIDSLETAIVPTGIDNLDLLPCGPLPSNPAEMLNSQAILDLFDQLSARYDQIVIDSPPVAPVTDARILGAICDVTVLVLRAEKSTRSLTEHACESLESVGATIAGVIVNDVPRRRDRYGYYYGYNYGYRYYQYGYGYGAKKGDARLAAGHKVKPAELPPVEAS